MSSDDQGRGSGGISSKYTEVHRKVDFQISTFRNYQSTAQAFLKIELTLASILLAAFSLRTPLRTIIPDDANIDAETLESVALKVAERMSNLSPEQGLVITSLLTIIGLLLIGIFLVKFLYLAPKYQLRVIRPSLFDPNIDRDTMIPAADANNLSEILTDYTNIIKTNESLLESTSCNLDSSFSHLQHAIIALILAGLSVMPLLYDSGQATVLVATFLLSILLLYSISVLQNRFNVDDARKLLTYNLWSDIGLLSGVVFVTTIAFFPTYPNIPDFIGAVLFIFVIFGPYIGSLLMSYEESKQYFRRTAILFLLNLFLFGLATFIFINDPDPDVIVGTLMLSLIVFFWILGVTFVVIALRMITEETSNLLARYILEKPPLEYLLSVVFKLISDENTKEMRKGED